jgi:uncharacterized OB-fold protein
VSQPGEGKAEDTGAAGSPKSLRIPYLMKIEYSYAAGAHATRFFRELRDHGRLWGVQCPSCQRVYVPPRPVCGICFQPAREWVQVGDEGEIVGCTVVRVPFIDPMTGKQRPVPYGFAIIRLDGASTALYHLLEETDPGKMYVGQRVKAVFRPQRTGSLDDILHFRAAEE